LLVTLLFCHEEILREPLLYSSLHFKQHRTRYFDLLQQVRTQGDWEAWLLFFVEGIREMAEGAVATARRLSTMANKDRQRIQSLGRLAGSALRVHQAMQEKPLGSIPWLVRGTGLSLPTVTAVLKALQGAGIVKEITGRKRNRLFSYEKYLDIMRQGTEA